MKKCTALLLAALLALLPGLALAETGADAGQPSRYRLPGTAVTLALPQDWTVLTSDTPEGHWAFGEGYFTPEGLRESQSMESLYLHAWMQDGPPFVDVYYYPAERNLEGPASFAGQSLETLRAHVAKEYGFPETATYGLYEVDAGLSVQVNLPATDGQGQEIYYILRQDGLEVALDAYSLDGVIPGAVQEALRAVMGSLSFDPALSEAVALDNPALRVSQTVALPEQGLELELPVGWAYATPDTPDGNPALAALGYATRQELMADLGGKEGLLTAVSPTQSSGLVLYQFSSWGTEVMSLLFSALGDAEASETFLRQLQQVVEELGPAGLDRDSLRFFPDGQRSFIKFTGQEDGVGFAAYLAFYDGQATALVCLDLTGPLSAEKEAQFDRAALSMRYQPHGYLSRFARLGLGVVLGLGGLVLLQGVCALLFGLRYTRRRRALRQAALRQAAVPGGECPAQLTDAATPVPPSETADPMPSRPADCPAPGVPQVPGQPADSPVPPQPTPDGATSQAAPAGVPASPHGLSRCPHCGGPTTGAPHVCPYCGQALPPEA